MKYSGAGGKLIHEKNRIKKSRDTDPLMGLLLDFFKDFLRKYAVVKDELELLKKNSKNDKDFLVKKV
jgi:hypothetical protein